MTRRLTGAIVLALLLPAGAASAQDVRMIQLEERQIVSWAFGDLDSLQSARKHADDLLNGKIEFVAAIGNLGAEQRRKLELAGRGDIVRYFNQCDELFRELPRGSIPQDEWQNVWQRLQPVRQQFALGLHEGESLFRKTVQCVLTPEQLATLEKLEHERALRHYRAQVAAALTLIDGRLPLTIEQRARLTDLLLASGAPPRMPVRNYYQYHYVLYRLSELPEADLKPIFDDVEWKVCRQLLEQGRSLKQLFQGLEKGQAPEGFW